MGLRFRKSFKLGSGTKVNFNKNSISFTAGTKGFHHTIGTSGRRTTTAGIPGSGLSYVSQSGGSAPSGAKKASGGGGAASPKKRGRGCCGTILFGCLGIIALMIVLAIFGTSDQKPPEETTVVASADESADKEAEEVMTSEEAEDAADQDVIAEDVEGVEKVEEIEEIEEVASAEDSSSDSEAASVPERRIPNFLETPEETAAEASADPEPAADVASDAAAPAAEASAPAAIDESAPVQAAAAAVPAAAAAAAIAGEDNSSRFDTYDNQEQSQTAELWVLNTSSMKIHRPGCDSVPKIAPQNYATSSLSVAELEAQGYTPCKKCGPY